MGLAQVLSRAGVGVAAPLVTVEVHAGGGLPRMSMVGLAETAVREARDRVRAALLNTGFQFPAGHVTISLAPADLPKEGSRFDLPIALGILAASGQVDESRLGTCEFVGELSLAGELNPVRGTLPVAIEARRAGRRLVVPHANGPEAALAGGGRQYAACSLAEVVDWLNGREALAVAVADDGPADIAPDGGDLCEVYGQHRARRALEIAAAGGHHLLLTGPPGTGKTMLASRLPGILPPLTEQEALDSAAVASISQAGLDLGHWRQRRFRAPHHTASSAALVGGGSRPKPGEISLAHHGVLFLDELPEFNRNVLEVLREPLESGRIVIARAASRAEFPSRFQLVAAMNPCPCGYHGDPVGRCRCTADQVQRYRGKISGPLLDRIDLQVDVPRLDRLPQSHEGPTPEPSAEVRARVVAARQLQHDRTDAPNAQMTPADMARHCRLDDAEWAFLEEVAMGLGLSPRACDRVLKVARTLADLDDSGPIRGEHLAEAISYRVPHMSSNPFPPACP